MMDTKHKLCYARISQYGVKEDILINQGLSWIQLMQELARQGLNMPARYEGATITIQWKPIEKHETSLETASREILAGLDMSQIEMETDEEFERRVNNPGDPKSPAYDPLYHEWVSCHSGKHRESKTPADLVILRKHIEQNYSGTQWWSGVHKW